MFRKLNETIVYPAVMTQEKKDVFVVIPDIDGGFTQGKDINDAIKMAKDAIITLLEDVKPEDYPTPSAIEKLYLDLKPTQKLIFIEVDRKDINKGNEDELDLKYLNDAIKKNKGEKRCSLDDVEKELGINNENN